jgi:hypothetical protein
MQGRRGRPLGLDGEHLRVPWENTASPPGQCATDAVSKIEISNLGRTAALSKDLLRGPLTIIGAPPGASPTCAGSRPPARGSIRLSDKVLARDRRRPGDKKFGRLQSSIHAMTVGETNASSGISLIRLTIGKFLASNRLRTRGEFALFAMIRPPSKSEDYYSTCTEVALREYSAFAQSHYRRWQAPEETANEDKNARRENSRVGRINNRQGVNCRRLKPFWHPSPLVPKVDTNMDPRG